jgi:hypothetical protein
VRPLSVVVPDVNAKDVLELSAADNQQSVEAFAAGAADPALDVGVCVRRLDGRADDLDLLARQEGVERAGELRVAVVDQEPHLSVAVSRSISRLRACCNIHAVFGLLVEARYSTRRLPIERKTSTYRRRSQTVSTVKKSHGEDRLAMRSQEAAPRLSVALRCWG